MMQVTSGAGDLTYATNDLMTSFSGFLQTFLGWGKWIFFGFLTINIVWLCLWYAFDKQSFQNSMSDFIKRFFLITLFYTIMLNPSWIFSIFQTAQVMGQDLVHTKIDPSSIINQGIGVANKILIPVSDTSLLREIFGSIIEAVAYVVVLFCFISVALELAVTLIVTTALITASTFFLGFSALGATTPIARQSLEVVLGYCVKLLGIYLVVAAGSTAITHMASDIPSKITSFDPYVWTAAVALLFHLLAKQIPSQLSRIVTQGIQDHHGASGAALALATMRYASSSVSAVQTAINVGKGALGGVAGVAKVAGSTLFNASGHFQAAKGSMGSKLKSAVAGATKDLGSNVKNNLSDHFKNLATKAAGGTGQARVAGISERMYNQGQTLKSKAASAKPRSKPNQ